MNDKNLFFFKRLPLFCALACINYSLFGQSAIMVNGKVVDRDGFSSSLVHTMIVDQNNGSGSFANSDGTFSISMQRNDTLLITARDYQIKKICFRDSLPKSSYRILVHLDSIHYELNEVTIHPTPNLKEIHKDINTLGIRNTDTYKDASLESPVTLLYERFSRIEQSKRKVAEMEDEDHRRQVLKDLFHLYIKYDIINLSDKDFDDFIDYLNLNDEFLRKSTDYELVMYIKQRYQSYMRDFGGDYNTK